MAANMNRLRLITPSPHGTAPSPVALTEYTEFSMLNAALQPDSVSHHVGLQQGPPSQPSSSTTGHDNHNLPAISERGPTMAGLPQSSPVKFLASQRHMLSRDNTAEAAIGPYSAPPPQQPASSPPTVQSVLSDVKAHSAQLIGVSSAGDATLRLEAAQQSPPTAVAMTAPTAVAVAVAAALEAPPAVVVSGLPLSQLSTAEPQPSATGGADLFSPVQLIATPIAGARSRASSSSSALSTSQTVTVTPQASDLGGDSGGASGGAAGVAAGVGAGVAPTADLTTPEKLAPRGALSAGQPTPEALAAKQRPSKHTAAGTASRDLSALKAMQACQVGSAGAGAGARINVAHPDIPAELLLPRPPRVLRSGRRS